jgi:hypothetical protein
VGQVRKHGTRFPEAITAGCLSAFTRKPVDISPLHFQRDETQVVLAVAVLLVICVFAFAPALVTRVVALVDVLLLLLLL